MAEDFAPARKPRVDAERNRARLVEAARAVFSDQGTTASLEEIARRAEVGIGTLYRHFPTRDSLIVEVYRAEAVKLFCAAQELSHGDRPIEALRHWLLLFVDYLSTKLILAEACKAMVDGEAPRVTATSREQLAAAITLLVDRAVESGDIAKGSIANPIDLLRALAGIAMAGAAPDWDQSARRMVDILIAGMRPSVKTG